MVKSTNLFNEIDRIDLQILDLMIKNDSNKHMSSTLKIPLSTIQRRVRRLIEKGFIMSKNYIDFTRFGFKSGTIHIYLNDCDMDVILDKTSKLKGVTLLEVHIGNSDIIADVVYKEGRDLLDVIAAIKRMAGVERIVWSERIFEYPIPSNKTSFLELE
ncbi:MAG TPA: winged helix-turn-helix transcriptional regulator [Candidatus Nitrosocosmicus sp.]|nr:winged helix-turn-helix transcriptional regulator [Candidatus Nitrosocosmicus sp.]